jgi:peptidoglycan/LPS O-acetylase OafA/YrhL
VAEQPPISDRLSPRIPALDGVRGLAIALVLLRHLVGTPLDLTPHLAGWRYFLWRSTLLYGYGVDLFFVLSGFLITRILLENRASPRLMPAFYARRCCRILPLYFIVLLGLYVLQHLLHADALWDWLFHGQHPWLSYATFTQNFYMGLAGTTGGIALAVTWSLAVEEQFYLGLPWVVRYLPVRYLPWLFAAGIPWALLARIHWNDWRSRTWLPSHADSLLAGCLLAWVCLQPAALAWLRRQGRGLTVLLLSLGVGLFFINQMPEYYVWICDTWMTLFFATLMLIGITQGEHLLTKFLELRWLGFLGTISYGVYLIHFPLLGFVFWHFRQGIPAIHSLGDVGLSLLSLALSLAFATISWFFFEKVWVRLGHRVKY